MVADGLLDEVRALLARGYGDELPSMSGLGYRQMAQHLRGEIDLDEAIALMRRDTRRFVRQQYNWFRLRDPRIHWCDVATDDTDIVVERAVQFLAGADGGRSMKRRKRTPNRVVGRYFALAALLIIAVALLIQSLQTDGERPAAADGQQVLYVVRGEAYTSVQCASHGSDD